jgi:serine protease Do
MMEGGKHTRIEREDIPMPRWSKVAFLVIAGFIGGSVFVGAWTQGQPVVQPAPRELTSYREVVKRVLPAVVSIETYAKSKPGAPLFDPNLPEQFRRPPGAAGDPNRYGFGSGFFVDAAGVVVTNFHVVEGAETAVVQLHDGRKFASKNIRSDRRTDVAVILLDAKDVQFPTLDFGDSDAMEIGDRVLAVGAPFGLAGSVTHGIISAKGRNGLNMNMYEDFVQTDAAINPGNSGGPLVNLEGKVVGVSAAIKTKSGGFQGVGLAVASNLAKNVVPALRTTGTVKRGYLGAQIRELDFYVAERFGLTKDGGVVLAEIYDKTPADKAQMKPGDIVTAVAGKRIKDGSALQRMIASLPFDRAVDVDVLREGKTVRLNVVIEEQPESYGINPTIPAPRQNRPLPKGTSLDVLGADLIELTDDVAEDRGFRKGTQGVVIVRVHEGGLADLNNLRFGTVITHIDGTRVASIAAAQQALQGADLQRGILLQIVTTQGGTNYVLLKSTR